MLTLPYCRLGQTDIHTSRIGLGTVKWGRNQSVRYPEPFDLPSDKTILNLLAVAKEYGINLLDTAPAYGTSEERLGQLLKNQRNDWIICTKAGEDWVNDQSHFDFSETAIQKSIERSLKRLNTDYLDIVLIHSDGNDRHCIETFATLSTLQKLKQAGWIRAIGMSTKTVDGGCLALDHADVVMVTHNPTYTAEQSVIAYAHQKQKGVLIKKALASGHLATEKSDNTDPVKTALNFIFNEPGVSSVVIGTVNTVHLKQIADCTLSLE